MLIPLSVDVHKRNFPLANWCIIGITSVVSIMALPHILAWEVHMFHEEFEQANNAVTNLLLLQRGRDFNIIQLLGCTLAHADWWHLFGNMIFLLAFGNSVNSAMENWEYLALYIICGICASLSWWAIGNGPGCLGASGAIMGIVGACMVLYPIERVKVLLWLWIYVRTFHLPVGIWAVMYLAFDLLAYTANTGGNVAYIAHLVGALTGALVMMLMIGTGYLQTDRRHSTLLELVGMQ